jgi:signal peptidase II
LKKYFQDYVFLAVVAGVIISMDQYTKYLVRTLLQPGEVWTPGPWLEPYARIVHWYNSGAAFGMFQGMGDVFMVLAVIVALVIIYYFPQVPRSDWPLRVAMGLQMGGAVGNLIDRIRVGSVTDFISIGNFAVFNIADASISTGVLVLVIGLWLKDDQEKAQPVIVETSPEPDDLNDDHLLNVNDEIISNPEEHSGE